MNRYAALLIAVILVAILTACGSQAEAPTISDEVTPEMLKKGETIFKSQCSSCHSATRDNVLVGPSMVGIAKRAGTEIKGMDAYDYLKQSILEPDAYLKEDFPNVMPQTYSNILSGEDLNAVIQYLLHLD